MSRRAAESKRLPWPLLAGAAVFVVLAIVLLMTRDRAPTFSGESALGKIEEQVAFGPRVPGTPAHAAALDWLQAELEPLADAVSLQPFTFEVGDTTFSGTNVVASFNLSPPEGRRVMLSAHWDTRPSADQDPDSTKRGQPVPGANDGASGVAVLLEMARLLNEHPPEMGVDFILFDLEDSGYDSGQGAETDSARVPFAIGSQRFVEMNPQYRPEYGILLDMVCDRDLRIPQEAYSRINAPAVMERVWAAARRVGATAFLDEPGGPVVDDHVPFLRAGIPVVDLVHYPFPATWHTTSDVPDACSAASLQQIGDVLVELLYGDG